MARGQTGKINGQRGPKYAKKKKAFEFWMMGLSVREVARRLDVSVGTAHNYLSEVSEEYKRNREKRAMNILDREIAALERGLLIYWPKAMTGDKGAMGICLKLRQQLHKLVGLENVNINIKGLDQLESFFKDELPTEDVKYDTPIISKPDGESLH